MEIEKLPPQAKDLEISVLGAILLEKNVFEQVADILTEDAFYMDSHHRIFAAMKSLSGKNMPIDILTLIEELRNRNDLEKIGGPVYVIKLTNSVFSAANIITHARIVLQKFIQRELIRISSETIKDAYNDVDVFDLLDEVEEKLFKITQTHITNDYKHISSGIREVSETIDRLREQDETVTGVPSGYVELDKITLGWQQTSLYILAARPSVGKTAFALNLARNAADRNYPVGFFSLEMSLPQLTKRLLSMKTKIWLKSLRNGRVDDSEMKILREGYDTLNNSPIYVDDGGSLNMWNLKAKARRMVNKHGVKMIIIDYLQLMTGDKNKNSNREQEISGISRQLKMLAKDLQIPIIALSQLSREIEKRGDKRPKLSDLRESGAIEQDADAVIFLYRPNKEDIEQDAELANKGQVNIEKHRDGELGDIFFDINLETQEWKDRRADVWRPTPNLRPLRDITESNNEEYF